MKRWPFMQEGEFSTFPHLNVEIVHIHEILLAVPKWPRIRLESIRILLFALLYA